MLGANFVLACLARLLVLFTACCVSGLATVCRWHFLLHALLEGRALLALALVIGLLARCTLLGIARLAAIDVLRLLAHALLAFGASLALAGLGCLLACFAVGGTGGRVGCLRAVALAALAGHRRQAAWAVAGVDTRATPMLRATRTHESLAALPADERLLGYLPYQPGMVAFGLPRALFGVAWWTDARVWFALVTAVAIASQLVMYALGVRLNMLNFAALDRKSVV